MKGKPEDVLTLANTTSTISMAHWHLESLSYACFNLNFILELTEAENSIIIPFQKLEN